MIIVNSRIIYQSKDFPYRIRAQVAERLGLDMDTVGAVIAAYETAMEEEAEIEAAGSEAEAE